MPKSMFRWSGLPGALAQVGELNQEQFSLFSNLLSNRQSFSPSKAAVKETAHAIGMGDDDLSYMISAVSFLYEQLDERTDNDERRDYISNFCASIGVIDGQDEDRKALLDRFESLLAITPIHEANKKIKRLEAGFIPTLISLKSLVDLRPNFSADRSGIEGWIPVIQVNLLTTSGDPQLASVTLQITKENISEIVQSFQDIELKMQAIAADSTLAISIIDR